MKDILEKYELVPVRPEVIDSSMLRTFMDCPSRFYLRYVLGLVRTVADHGESAKFDWGTCWHSVLEAYFSNKLSIKAGLVAMEENYPAYITPTTDKKKRSKDRMAEAFFAYSDNWKEQDKEYDILSNEQFFDVFSEEENLRWAGRMDQIRRRKRNNKIRVWDFKTSSAMGDYYFTSHELGFQFPGYVWAGDLLVPGEEVEEITIDVFYMISASMDFFRRTFRYDKFRKAEWVRNITLILDRMNFMLDNYLEQPDMWELNWNECTRYGPCMFLGVHNTAPRGDTRLRILSNDYRISRWDPRGETEDD